MNIETVEGSSVYHPSDITGSVTILPDIQWTHAAFLTIEDEINQLLRVNNFADAVERAEKLQQQCVRSGDAAYLEAPQDTAKAYFILGQALQQYGDAQLALQPLSEAQRRYKILATWGAAEEAQKLIESLSAQGDCLRHLGRLKEAATAYEQAIHYASHKDHHRHVANNKVELATTYVQMGHYGDALTEYQDAFSVIQQLNDADMMISILIQMGIVYSEVNHFGQAESAFVEAWNLSEDSQNRSRSADALTELGNMWNIQDGVEEAIGFYQQAAAVYVELGHKPQEGAVRSNLADVLIKQGRFTEARVELERAIECEIPLGHAAEPWKTWNIVRRLHQEVNDPVAEADAQNQAISSYTAYRRAGGTSQSAWAPLCILVQEAIERDDSDKAENVLAQLLAREDLLVSDHHFIRTLQMVLRGDRGAELAENSELNYLDVAELKLLFESLETSE